MTKMYENSVKQKRKLAMLFQNHVLLMYILDFEGNNVKTSKWQPMLPEIQQKRKKKKKRVLQKKTK